MSTSLRDWRLPENRREAFLRFYGFHLQHRSHPGMVYSFLPAIAEAYDLDADGRAWLTWLNGNTQNAVTSLLLLEAAPKPWQWPQAVDFWNDNFAALEWDTDRRHQKRAFGEATEAWATEGPGRILSAAWYETSEAGWGVVWDFAKGHPHMGRLSAWSMSEYARILFPNVVPDAATLLLEDKAGSRSHRNGLALIAGYNSVYWEAEGADLLGITQDLADLGESLLAEAIVRTWRDDRRVDCTGESQWGTLCVEPHHQHRHPDVSRLTLESALCTYKSWHKPNRRYPNVYADMMYQRIKKAEARFGRSLDLLWETRQRDLPEYLRLEDCPSDPGLSREKQNHYLETGCPVMMHRDYPDMDDGFMAQPRPLRKDPKW